MQRLHQLKKAAAVAVEVSGDGGSSYYRCCTAAATAIFANAAEVADSGVADAVAEDPRDGRTDGRAVAYSAEHICALKSDKL